MKTVMTGIMIAFVGISSFASNLNEGVDPLKKVFDKWTKTYVSYPTEASKQNEEGMVFVSFEIDLTGSMINVSTASALPEKFNQKAIEIVNAMPKKQLYAKGFIEGTVFVLPVKFNID